MWGEAHGLARLHPAKIAYGGAEGEAEERGAWEASIAAGVTLFDTAAMYAGGASERRLGQFSSDAALIATKFPATICHGPDAETGHEQVTSPQRLGVRHGRHRPSSSGCCDCNQTGLVRGDRGVDCR